MQVLACLMLGKTNREIGRGTLYRREYGEGSRGLHLREVQRIDTSGSRHRWVGDLPDVARPSEPSPSAHRSGLRVDRSDPAVTERSPRLQMVQDLALSESPP